MLYPAAVLMKLGSFLVLTLNSLAALFRNSWRMAFQVPSPVAWRTGTPLTSCFGLVAVASALASLLSAQVLPPVELHTGNGSALQRQSVAMEHRSSLGDASLRFEIDWFSDEVFSGVGLSDAFTVTVRDVARSYVATLVTMDAGGPTWLPSTPGGASIPAQDLLFSALPDADLAGHLARFRLYGLLRLPDILRTQQLVLTVSLFDNLDSVNSRGVLLNHRFAPTIDLPIQLESADTVLGPFALLTDAILDRATRRFTVPKQASRKFFRLESLTASRIRTFRRDGEEWVFDYEGEIGQPVVLLEGSNDRVNFTPVTNAIVEVASGRATIPLFRSPAFFRFGGSHPVRVTGDEVTGDSRVLRFEVFPPIPRLMSAALPSGPFAFAPTAKVDPFAKRIRLPVAELARFFRLRSEIPLTLGEVSDEGSHLIIRYDEP